MQLLRHRLQIELSMVTAQTSVDLLAKKRKAAAEVMD